MTNRFRALPKIDAVCGDSRLERYPAELRAQVVRDVVAEHRSALAANPEHVLPEDWAGQASERLEILVAPRQVPVLNATGVVIHTNLGRAPWSRSARQAALDAMGYCAVEMDLATGARGRRMAGVSAKVAALTGAEAALAVNNCAAAVLLVLTALARGREVVVSRGELVEIGGSFRVPEVIAAGGALLREVGATNRTRVDDYEAAIGEHTAMLLKVHPSNFRIEGFHEEASRSELAELAASRGLPFVEDLGSGSIGGRGRETSVREVVAAGVDLVCFSGDKLLGGPQAGIIAGRAEWVNRVAKHPMARALRLDKVALAGLEATLADHLLERPTPVEQMLDMAAPRLARRAEAWVEGLAQRGVTAEVAASSGRVGGGALPEESLPGAVVVLREGAVHRVAAALRQGSPAIVARIQDNAVVLDPRTVGEEHDAALLDGVAQAVRAG